MHPAALLRNRYHTPRVRYRKLGRYGIKLSEISLGGWLTHGRTLADDQVAAIVRSAFDLGINFFDTADVYNKGAAEIALGKAIRSFRREDIVIGTKCFFAMSDNPNDRGLSRKHVFESVHASLSRIGVEYVDLMQFHRFDLETPLDETIRAIDDLIRQGKVLYWGVSEWTASQITDACHIARTLGCCPPISNQPLYNLQTRRIESEVMGVCHREGLGLVVFSPLAQGVLTGKYRPGEPPPPGSRGADESSNVFMVKSLEDKVLEAVRQVGDLASQAGCTLAQFALAWCLRRPEVTSAIVGATSVEQLQENAKASGLEIHPALFAKAEAVFDEALGTA